MAKAKQTNTVRRLYRSDTDVIIAGVAGGLGEYFEIDPVIIRLLFLSSIFFGGFGIPVYIVLWILLPKKHTGTAASEETIKENVAEMRNKVESFTENMRVPAVGKNPRNLFAIILILLGTILFLSKLGIIHMDLLWPLFLILVGFFLFTR